MQFTPEELSEFQELCERHLGFRPTLEEAKSEGTKLVHLVSLIQPRPTYIKDVETLKTSNDKPTI